MRIEQKQRIDLWLGAVLLLALKPVIRLAGGLARRNHDLEPRGEVVVVKLLGGGSLVLALPGLLGLRRRYPRLALTLVCGRGVASFGALLGVFDRIECIDDSAGLLPLLWSGARTLGSLVRRKIDTVVDFEVYSMLSVVFSAMTGARNRIGFYLENVYWRRGILTHLVFLNRAAGSYHFYAAATRLLGAPPATRDECREHLLARLATLRGPGAAAKAPAELLQEPFVVVGAGCSEFGSVRLLPPAEWRAFAAGPGAELVRLPWVFLGTAADRAVSEAVADAVRERAGDAFRFQNLCGELPLEESLGLLARAQQFVGIDSALLHVARTLRVPSVSFWGPTHPATRLEPDPLLREVVHYRPPLCSPCIHVAEAPPCKGNNLCMALFTRSESHRLHWCEDANGQAVRMERES